VHAAAQSLIDFWNVMNDENGEHTAKFGTLLLVAQL
jgi:hypothetical protein